VTVLGGIFFLVCALVAILAAVATVAVRNPIRAAVGLLFHILALAGLYLTLHAHLLAALQLIVYAGAIVVLFVFVIMLIGPSANPPGDTRGLFVRAVAGGLMALLTAAIAFAIIEHTAPAVAIEECAASAGAACTQFGGVEAMGNVLFKGALVPFELISVLLTVAIVGAVAVARGRTAAETQALKDKRVAGAAAAAAKTAEEKRIAAEVSAHHP